MARGFTKFGKSVRRALSKFSRGGLVQGTIRPLLEQKIIEAANAGGSGTATGTGRYRLGYRKRRRYSRGRGLYTGSGLYTGYGKYSPARNALISGSKSTNNVVPSFRRPTDNETTTISRREYVSEIYGPPLGTNGNPAPFVIQKYSINPGLERTFPWLSQLAQNFEEYELLQCIFTFKSTTTESGNQVNGQVGTVIMATNYNAAASVFHEKNTMMQYAGSSSSRLTETLLHGVECDPRKNSGSKGEYIRSNPVVTGQDLKSYDHGLFQIAIANCTANLANQSLGELWVSYTVKLRKPKFYTSLGFGITKDIFRNNPGLTNVLTTAPFGTGLLRGQQNSLGCQVKGHNTWTFSSGTVVPGVFYEVIFPATYSGNIRILMTEKFQAGTIGVFRLQHYGNVTPLYDLYGYDPTTANGPTQVIYHQQSPQAMMMADMNVTIATNGVDNRCVFGYGLNTDVYVDEIYLEVGEYNAGFSYLATNLGSTTVPVWVDTSGTVYSNA